MLLAIAAPGSIAEASSASAPAEASAGSAAPHPYEYLFVSGAMYVYDMSKGQELVQEVTNLPDTDGVRGAMVNPATHTLYISHGGDGPMGSFDGSLLAYDLLAGKTLWDRAYGFPIDSGALSYDGAKIYMPSGENEPSGVWNVLSAATGEPIGKIQGGAGAHNTIASLDGKYVYLAGRDSNLLDVVSTETDRVVRQIGPLVDGVRPFTVNASDTLAYTTASEYLGFQVSSITTGKVLFTVPFPGLASPYPFSFSAPSHGITLTPDEKRLYVFDAVAEEVRVFDVSRVPQGPPVELTPVKIAAIAGEQSQCAYDCTKSGWLQSSLDGRFVYVGDSASVIDTSTDSVVAEIPELAQTRVLLEIDWAGGVPTMTSTRYGLGRAAAAAPSSPPPDAPRPQGNSSPAQTGQPGQTPAATPSGQTPATGPGFAAAQSAVCGVSLVSTHLMAASHVSVTARLARTGSAECRGTLTLRYRLRTRDGRSRKQVIGSVHFALGANERQAVEIQLNGLGRALLRARGRLNATATILRSAPAPALATSLGVRLSLKTTG